MFRTRQRATFRGVMSTWFLFHQSHFVCTPLLSLLSCIALHGLDFSVSVSFFLQFDAHRRRSNNEDAAVTFRSRSSYSPTPSSISSPSIHLPPSLPCIPPFILQNGFHASLCPLPPADVSLRISGSCDIVNAYYEGVRR